MMSLYWSSSAELTYKDNIVACLTTRNGIYRMWMIKRERECSSACETKVKDGERDTKLIQGHIWNCVMA